MVTITLLSRGHLSTLQAEERTLGQKNTLCKMTDLMCTLKKSYADCPKIRPVQSSASYEPKASAKDVVGRGEICHCCHCRRQCKFFASGVNCSIFTHFIVFFLTKLLKLGEIGGEKFLTWKSGGVKFWTNSMSASLNIQCHCIRFTFISYKIRSHMLGKIE